MKLKEFTYTKPDQTISQRAVVVTSEPSTLVCGYDVSQLSDDEFAAFVRDYRKLVNEQQGAMAALLAKHDLTHNYRNFLPDRMSNVTTEHV